MRAAKPATSIVTTETLETPNPAPSVVRAVYFDDPDGVMFEESD